MLKNKLYIVAVLLFLISVSVYAIYSDVGTLYEKVQNINSVKQKLSQISSYQKIIKELQKERGLGVIYRSDNTADVYKTLLQQKKRSQEVIQQQSKLITVDQLLVTLKKLQAKLLDQHTTQQEIYELYTDSINDLLRETYKLLLYTNDPKIKNRLLQYQKLSLIQEYFGELRASVGAIIGDPKRDAAYLPLVQKSEILLENHIQELAAFSQDDKADTFYTLLQNTPSIQQVKKIVHSLLSQDTTPPKLSSLEWFSIATQSVETIHQYATKKLNIITNEAHQKAATLQKQFNTHIVFWLISILVGIGMLIILFVAAKEIAKKNRLLSDYKKAIDTSTIVSKTDKQGKITYANRAFCEISGYTEEELLGKSHNIVRHPDMPKEIFQELWETLKNGKTWQGEVKNKKKDGGYYWVQATISPIYDNENNLVEYIAIRQDITEILDLNEEIQTTQKELIFRIGESVESRSKETGNHIRRVAKYSELLGRLYGLDANSCETLSIASTMHDVGKIAIPDSLLLKPSKLSQDEFEIMKTHTYIGYKILSGSKLPILKMAAEIAYGHHERYNGGGYPRNVSGEDIPLCARIVSVADVFDALISDRVYKKAWDLERVVELFAQEKGKQFDPKIAALLLENIDMFMAIKEQYED
jgi:PAS domain S-box-containing protein